MRGNDKSNYIAIRGAAILSNGISIQYSKGSLHNSNSFTWFNEMIEIELHYLIPRRFPESSPLAQGCVFDILKVFIKRAAGVAGKVLCFVIVSLPMFFHLKLHILNS